MRICASSTPCVLVQLADAAGHRRDFADSIRAGDSLYGCVEVVAAVGEEAAGKRGGRVLLGGAAFDVDGAGAEEFVQGMRADKKTGTLGVVVEQCDGFWNEG